MQPTFLEFFAGAGLARLGLQPEWRCLWANDISAKKCEIYRANFGSAELVGKDVAELAAGELPRAVMAWASFPCQDLSLAGWRRGMSASRSGAFWAFWRLMHEQFRQGSRPPVLVIENVVGLLYGENFRGLCEALAALDMRFGGLVVDAKKFVCQSRPRVFVIAVDSRLEVSDLASPNADRGPWFPKRLQSAFEPLPASIQSRWLWWRLPAPSEPPVAIERLVEWENPRAEWRSAAEIDRLLDLMTPRNRAKIHERMAAGGHHVGFLYRRMRGGAQRAEARFDGIAGCLRTPEGGSSRQTVILIQDGLVRMRLLTTREAAHLMGAPPDYRLPANYNDGYRAMGDGVVVPVVRWLSRHLLTPLARMSLELADDDGWGSRPDLPHLKLRAEARASEWLHEARSSDC